MQTHTNEKGKACGFPSKVQMYILGIAYRTSRLLLTEKNFQSIQLVSKADKNNHLPINDDMYENWY